MKFSSGSLATYKGRYSRAEGKPVDFRLLHVCEFDGDRISREQVWLDVNALRTQAS